MDDAVALRRNNEPLDLGTLLHINLRDLATSNQARSFTIEQLIAALESTTTLTDLRADFFRFDSTPENNRRFIEPLCRCIANLRRHNQNHPLREFRIFNANNKDHDVEPLLVAAKQYGIHSLEFNTTLLPIHSLVEFCRDNNHLKVLEIFCATLLDEESTISVYRQHAGPQDSSAILTLDKLVLSVTFENSTAATKFLNFMAHVTYPVLHLGHITVGGNEVSEEEKKVARMPILSALIKPSVEQLTLQGNCQIEVMDVIEACATVTQIELSNIDPPRAFFPAAVQVKVQQKLQAVTARNNELARFRANPRAYPGNAMLALMCQFDNNPTGRFMLARCFPEMPSFFKF